MNLYFLNYVSITCACELTAWNQIEEQITEELAATKAKSSNDTAGLSSHCEIEQPASGEASSINIEMDEDAEKEKNETIDRVSIE